MSIQALNWALAQDQIENSATRFVLLILCNYANENGQCYPSRETIAKKTSLSIRTVQTHLNWLAENGYIKWEQQRIKDKQAPNVYQLIRVTQSVNLAPSITLQSANDDIPECNSRHFQGATVALNTKEENQRRTKDKVREIFEFWKTTMNLNGGTLLTPKREKVIKDRLGQGYTVARLKNAILGNHASAYHQGQNDSQTVYNDIELICRSGEKVEFFEQKYTPIRSIGCELCLNHPHRHEITIKGGGYIFDPETKTAVKCKCNGST